MSNPDGGHRPGPADVAVAAAVVVAQVLGSLLMARHHHLSGRPLAP